MVFPAALLWRAQRNRSTAGARKTLVVLNPRRKGRTFWLVSFVMLFFSLAFYPLFALLLPVFMTQQLGYDYTTIGIAFMFYGLLAASVTFSTLRLPLGIQRVIVQSAIALLVMSLLAVSNNYFLVLFLALAFADDLGIGFF